MRGKLIVIDGLDGSGKSTQTARVFERLKRLHERVLLISYPDYAEESSALVRMYLNGEFSDNPADVNAYAASSFYAVDRYASYMKNWKRYYEEGYLILATRYVSSNAIHQMVKLPRENWPEYLTWLDDFEYGKLELPRPDTVIFLDMPRAVAERLIDRRGEPRDIHERNTAYLRNCEETAHFAAQAQGWRIVPCAEGENPRDMEEITGEILRLIE
jgi:dTMP kinase